MRLTGLSLISLSLAVWLLTANCAPLIEITPSAGLQIDSTPIALASPSSTPTFTQPVTAPILPLSTPAETPTSAPAASWHEIYAATPEDLWPAWCITLGDDGWPISQLPAGGGESTCFNQSFNQLLADFAVEWTIRVEGRAALLVFGQEATFYQLTVPAGEGTLTLQPVSYVGGPFDPTFSHLIAPALRSESGASNTITIARLRPTLTVSVNGAEVTQVPDTLLGDHTPIKVGFGAAAYEGGETMVYLEGLKVYRVAR